MALIRQGNTTLNAGSKGDKGDKGEQGISGGSNGNITPVTSLAELLALTVDEKIIDIQAPITLLANHQILAEQWIFSTGYVDVDTFELDLNGATLQFNGIRKGLDLFDGTVTGTVFISKKIVYATNLGAKDDDLDTTDNHQVGLNALHIVNQNSGHLIWNKKDTGKYWASVGYPSDYDSSFFPTSNDRVWIVGKGYDNVIVEHSDTEIINITNNYKKSKRYIFYNTKNSVIRGGIIRGDRYRHYYDQTLYLTSGATSAGDVNLVINETHPFRSTEILKTITKNIPLTLSSVSINLQEVVDFINSDSAFVDYTATNLGLVDGDEYTFSIRGKGGNDFRFTFTDVDSGAILGNDYSTHEGGHGIAFGSNSTNNIVENIHITEFHGDGIANLTQGNGTTGINFIDLAVGDVSPTTGIADANADYYHLTTARDLPSQHNHFSFAPNAQSSTKLLQFRYWMVYYEDDGTTFIEKSPELIPYERYTTLPEWKKYKIVVDNPGAEISDFNFFLNSRSEAIGSIMQSIEISFCRRQGMSDPSHNFVIRDSKIHDTGGTEPQFGIDLEDLHKHGRGFLIDNVEFWNNANGDIIMKGVQNGNVQNCFFKQNSRNVKGGVNEEALAIDSGYGRFITISNNNFEYKKVVLDLGAKFENNQMFYGSVLSRPGGAIIQNNYLVNTLIHGGVYDGAVNSQGLGKNALCYVKGNTRVISDFWKLNFDDDGNQYVKENERILFNEQTNLHWLTTDPTLQEVRPNTTSSSYLRAERVLADVPETKGSIDNMEILGLLPNEVFRTQMSYPIYVSNVNRLNVEFPLEVNFGFPRAVTIKNSKAYMLSLTLGQFATDGVGTFPTFTFENNVFRVPERIDATHGWLDNSGYGTNFWFHEKFIRSDIDKNVNLYFDKNKFINDDGGTGHFMFLGHRGTTVFKECEFSNVVADIIDFTSIDIAVEETAGAYTSTNTGDITIIDPVVENITFTLRGQDYVVFTKPSPLMTLYASFADEAAAATAGYPSGYLYVITGTGEIRMKL